MCGVGSGGQTMCTGVAVSPVSGTKFRYRCGGGSMSGGGGFMIAMATACTDTTAVRACDVVPRRRGRSKAANFKYDGPVSVIGLELDVSDERLRRRLERQWAAVFRLRRGCGLCGDRDIVSAILAACVTLADPDDPRTARVDYRLAHALRAWLASQQEWEGSVNRHQPPPSSDAGSATTGSHPRVASAEQAALGPPPNSPGTPGRSRTQPKTTSVQADWRCMTHDESTLRVSP